MMSALFREKGATLDLQLLASDEAQRFINTHAATLDKAFERVPMSDRMRQRLQRSDYIFSGIKTFHELNEAFPSLLDENGNRKPFEQFLNDVQKIDKTYNQHYLQAEYNFVQSSAEMAAKWEQYAQDGDRYNLQYRTAGDEKVRPAHAELNGITLPQSDSFWESYYPPNGWNCFVKGTPVLTSHGWKCIDRIKEGDLVFGGSGNLRQVTATMARTVEGEIVTIFAEGMFATCTENHRFCTPHGWVTAKELQPGDIIIQLGKVALKDKAVQAIHNVAAIARKALMAVRRKGKTVPTLTIDYKAKRRYVKVGNVTTKQMKLVEWETRCNEIAPDLPLGGGEWPLDGTHSFGVKGAGMFARRYGFGHDIRTEEGGSFAELLRHSAHKLGVLLRLALARVTAFLCKTVVHTGNKLAGGPAAAGVANPLGGNGGTTMADGNAAESQYPVNSPTVHMPVAAQPAEAAQLRHIPQLAGIKNAHAFNGFNSCLDFIRKTLLHNRYIVVEGKVTEKKRISVYNLSINQDESYIVPVGIAHNCRCTVVQVRKSKYPETPHDEAMARGESALEDDKKGIFRFNSGKEQKAVPDYNAYTIRRCRDCDVAKGKINLAKPLDNELCEACRLIRSQQANVFTFTQKRPLIDVESDRGSFRTQQKEVRQELGKNGPISFENQDLYTGRMYINKDSREALTGHSFDSEELMVIENLPKIIPSLKNGWRIELDKENHLYEEKNEKWEHMTGYAIIVNGKRYTLKCAAIKHKDKPIYEHPYSLKKEEIVNEDGTKA